MTLTDHVRAKQQAAMPLMEVLCALDYVRTEAAAQRILLWEQLCGKRPIVLRKCERRICEMRGEEPRALTQLVYGAVAVDPDMRKWERHHG